jgi:hypothetical protein
VPRLHPVERSHQTLRARPVDRVEEITLRLPRTQKMQQRDPRLLVRHSRTERFLERLVTLAPYPNADEFEPLPVGAVLPAEKRTHGWNITIPDHYTAAQRRDLIHIVLATNAYIAEVGKAVDLHATSGEVGSDGRALGDAKRLSAMREKSRADLAGEPYKNGTVPSHLPDTTVSGNPKPKYGWGRHDSDANSRVGGAIGNARQSRVRGSSPISLSTTKSQPNCPPGSA